MKILGWSITIGVIAFMIYTLGIGAWDSSPVNATIAAPQHEFWLFGPKGALPSMFAVAWFSWTLISLNFIFSGPCLQDTGTSYKFRPAVWGCVLIWFLLALGCSVTMDMRWGCPPETYANNGNHYVIGNLNTLPPGQTWHETLTDKYTGKVYHNVRTWEVPDWDYNENHVMVKTTRTVYVEDSDFTMNDYPGKNHREEYDPTKK